MRVVSAALAAALLASWGWAAGVSVLAPPERFVAPGEYVTLVFRLSTDAPVEVRLAVATTSGWTVVSRLGDVALDPMQSVPVAVTIEVPRDAPAFVSERVTLTVDADGVTADHEVVLTVGERSALGVEAPSTVTLSGEGVRVTVRNDGNGPERAVLELRHGSGEVARRELELVAGERLDVRFDLRDDGLHTLVLVGERSGEVRRSLRVMRFGAPQPEPLWLAGEAAGAIGSSGAWQASVGLRGPLSDLATLDARLDAASPRRSFAEVTLGHAAVRVGGGWRDPLRLGVPSGVGAAGSYRTASTTVTGAIGGDERGFVGGVAAGWSGAAVRLAAGVGWSDDAAWLAARAVADGEVTRWSVATTYLRAALTVTLASELRDGDATTRFELDARELLTDGASLAGSLQVRDGTGSLYADASVGADEVWSGRFGVTQRIVSTLPGELRFAAQVGTLETYARVSHQASAGGGWRSATGVGVRTDATGFGVTFDSAWSYVGADAFGADARLVYHPGTGALGGRVAVRYQLEREAITLSLGGTWDLSERDAGASAAIGWRDGPWRVDVSAGAAYVFDDTAPWSGSVTLSTRYAFDLVVPDSVVDLAGGRNLGMLVGRVLAEDEPLAGVELSVGRYRVRSDEAGTFTLEVPPGSYPVAVDIATLPIAFQIVDGARATVDVLRSATTEFTVAAVRTTVLRGSVLEDRDGDGRADEPPVGVRARLLVTDAQGLRRSVVSDADGAFEVRGLVPGAIRVRLVETPAGATVVGDDARTLQLESGVPADVAFLVRPAVVSVQAFTAQALRIRSVVLEVDRVPPGAAPLVRVEAQGEPDAVTVVTGDGEERALERDGDVWFGRVVVPVGQPAGVLSFTVVVRSADTEATRRGQLIVDPGAPVLLVTSDAPVRAGAVLTVRVSAYLEARSIVLAQPFGDDVALVEDEPGRWSGAITVPEGIPDAVYELEVRVAGGDGRAFVEPVRFRVLDP